MGFDITSYLMGKSGKGPPVKGDVTSWLMGKAAGGGGGGGTTLEESGWIKSKGTNTVVSGNIVDMQSGNKSHNVSIAPPASVRESTQFIPGDVLILGFKVTSIRTQISVLVSQYKDSAIFESETGLVTMADPDVANGRIASTGEDELTYRFLGDSGYNSAITFNPVTAGGGNESYLYATMEVTKLVFNGVRYV